MQKRPCSLHFRRRRVQYLSLRRLRTHLQQECSAPKRNVTLTALQALSTLNDPFVLRQCEHFAERLKAAGSTANNQVQMAFRLTLNREPTTGELRLMSNYARKHGLANACRVLLNSSEFFFVD